jgi:alpha-L-fucosidase
MRSSPAPGALAALVCLLAACESTPPGTDPAQVPANQVERMAWWRDARFGMFIHWGLYAIPAGKWNNVTDTASGSATRRASPSTSTRSSSRSGTP